MATSPSLLFHRQPTTRCLDEKLANDLIKRLAEWSSISQRLPGYALGMTDLEIAEELVDRLRDFSPAVSVGPGEDDDQVEVSITMSRTPYTAEQMVRLEAGMDPGR